MILLNTEHYFINFWRDFMINGKDFKRKQKLDILKYLYVNTQKGMVKNAMPFNM